MDQAASEAGYTRADLIDKGRRKTLDAARTLAMRQVRALSPKPSITKMAGWFARDHSTISHACRGVG